MQSGNSVTRWLRQMEAGDTDATERLWDRYFDSLVRLARNRLRGQTKISDEEDLAIDVFTCLYNSARDGKVHMKNRDELWRLLLTITKRKAIDQRRYYGRQRRGGEGLWDEVKQSSGPWSNTTALEDAEGPVPTPETIAILNDEFQRRMESLKDDVMRRIVRMKLERFTNDEIARELKVATRTVERKLQLIREEWSQDLDVK